MKLRHMGTNSTKILTTLFANEITMTTPVADPGFSPGGAPTLNIAIIFQIFAENCMKMKEFGPPGRASLSPPLDPPMHTQHKDMTPMRTVLVTSVSLVKISAVTSAIFDMEKFQKTFSTLSLKLNYWSPRHQTAVFKVLISFKCS